jgi:hypothetical protein
MAVMLLTLGFLCSHWFITYSSGVLHAMKGDFHSRFTKWSSFFKKKKV